MLMMKGGSTGRFCVAWGFQVSRMAGSFLCRVLVSELFAILARQYDKETAKKERRDFFYDVRPDISVSVR